MGVLERTIEKGQYFAVIFNFIQVYCVHSFQMIKATFLCQFYTAFSADNAALKLKKHV